MILGIINTRVLEAIALVLEYHQHHLLDLMLLLLRPPNALTANQISLPTTKLRFIVAARAQGRLVEQSGALQWQQE
jgi:hypothetical protein